MPPCELLASTRAVVRDLASPTGLKHVPDARVCLDTPRAKAAVLPSGPCSSVAIVHVTVSLSIEFEGNLNVPVQRAPGHL
jgi:hypothetical protein